MTFKTWIKRFEGEQNAIGDLARDIGSDNEFPAIGTENSYRTYLFDKNAVPNAIETFEKAWHHFEEDVEEGERIENEEVAAEIEREENAPGDLDDELDDEVDDDLDDKIPESM